MTELDLEIGDEERAARIAEANSAGRARSQRVRAARSSSSKEGNSKSSSVKSDSDLVSRLHVAFDKLADQLEARHDEELATAIREDKEAMSRGLVSLTRSVKFLRSPLVLFLNVLEPVLAFWRVGGILGRRFIERRQRIVAERQAAASGVVTTEYDPTAVA